MSLRQGYHLSLLRTAHVAREGRVDVEGRLGEEVRLDSQRGGRNMIKPQRSIGYSFYK